MPDVRERAAVNGEGWSEESRRRVAECLSSLPEGTPEKACRAALRVAYPFGPRQHWPYKAWSKAARAALAVRFPAAPPVGCAICSARGFVTFSAARGSEVCRVCGGTGRK